MKIRLDEKEIDTDKLTYEEMQALAINIDEEITKIDKKLHDAKVAFYQTGKRANQKWFDKLFSFSKDLKRRRQELQILIGQRKSFEKKKNVSLANLFMDVAYEYLPPGDFDRIKAIAEKRRGRIVGITQEIEA